MRSIFNYQKSNRVKSVNFPISPTAKNLFSRVSQARSAEKRQELGQLLLDELADLAKIDIVNLKISNTRQYHKKYQGRIVSRQYGYYRPKSSYIYINNRTAARGQILANKSFAETLLHEWLHHYDFKKLKLNSIHTAGFYARLRDLKEKLGYFIN